jgi:hypothetical protein
MIIGRSLTPLDSARTLRGVRRREMDHSSDDNSRLSVQNVRGDSSDEPRRQSTRRSAARFSKESAMTEVQAASSSSAKRIGTSTPSANRAAITSSPFIASMNLRRVPT